MQNEIDLQRIKKLRGMGASQKFIAETLGVSRGTISQGMEKEGIRECQEIRMASPEHYNFIL